MNPPGEPSNDDTRINTPRAPGSSSSSASDSAGEGEQLAELEESDVAQSMDELAVEETLTSPNKLRERELVAVLATEQRDSAAWSTARDELVTLYLPLVVYLARRYRDRGETFEDLVQVGTVGLIKAVDRFDAERGFTLSTYATPTILGEIKRHFRDRTWSVRVPRRLQELRSSLATAAEELSQRSGRAPSAGELAAHLGLSVDEVVEGLEGARAYRATSLDAPVSGGREGDGATVGELLGDVESAFEAVENREALKPLLAALPSRERRILVLRFFHDMTQSQIADEVGVSQMHVSRLLGKSLASLREGLERD